MHPVRRQLQAARCSLSTTPTDSPPRLPNQPLSRVAHFQFRSLHISIKIHSTRPPSSAMFAPRSPDTGERKRPGTDPERPGRPITPLLRLYPPSEHRRAQALAQSQHMPYMSADWHEGAGREQTTFSSESDNRILANCAQSQAPRSRLVIY